MPHRFIADLRSNRHNRAILDRWPAFALPDGWLVAGCLFQTVWNLRSGRPPEADIKDYDIFYFDASDLTEAGERAVQARVEAVVADLGITVEVANQARVHLWYPGFFGEPYPALENSRDGIDRFLVACTCVGVRPDGELHAPWGLDDLYDGRLRPNPLTPYGDLYARKASSYRARWPWLRDEGAAGT